MMTVEYIIVLKSLFYLIFKTRIMLRIEMNWQWNEIKFGNASYFMRIYCDEETWDVFKDE